MTQTSNTYNNKKDNLLPHREPENTTFWELTGQ